MRLPEKFMVHNIHMNEYKTLEKKDKQIYEVYEEDGAVWTIDTPIVVSNIKEGLWTINSVFEESNPIKPDHYHKGGIDVIGFSEKQFSQDELKGFYRINCLKYITRYDRKGGLTDLKKADFYLGKLMEMEESE
jgi:Protein of unknwon function (DUF3310)